MGLFKKDKSMVCPHCKSRDVVLIGAGTDARGKNGSKYLCNYCGKEYIK